MVQWILSASPQNKIRVFSVVYQLKILSLLNFDKEKNNKMFIIPPTIEGNQYSEIRIFVV